MATIPQYVNELLRRQIQVAPLLGTEVMSVDRQSYALNLELLTLLAVVMKGLNDKGVINDAEWLNALDHALDGDWPDWIVHQTPPP